MSFEPKSIGSNLRLGVDASEMTSSRRAEATRARLARRPKVAQNLVCIAFALILVSGWFDWARQRRRRDACSLSALMGYSFATVSLLIAVASVIYAGRIGGFAHDYPLLRRLIRLGLALSFGALAFALMGVCRPSALRWYALGLSLGTLFFWVAATMI